MRTSSKYDFGSKKSLNCKKKLKKVLTRINTHDNINELRVKQKATQ